MDTTTLLIVLAVALVAVFLIKKKGGDAPAESATDAGDSREPEQEVVQQSAPVEEDADESHADEVDGSGDDAPMPVEEVAPSAFDAGGEEASEPSEMATPSDEVTPVEEEASSSAFGDEDSGGDASTEGDHQGTPSRDGDPYA